MLTDLQQWLNIWMNIKCLQGHPSCSIARPVRLFTSIDGKVLISVQTQKYLPLSVSPTHLGSRQQIWQTYWLALHWSKKNDHYVNPFLDRPSGHGPGGALPSPGLWSCCCCCCRKTGWRPHGHGPVARGETPEHRAGSCHGTGSHTWTL